MKEEDLTPEQRETWVSGCNALWERKEKLGKQMDRSARVSASLEKDYTETMRAEEWLLKNPISDWTALPSEHVAPLHKAVELVKQRLVNEVSSLSSLISRLPKI